MSAKVQVFPDYGLLTQFSNDSSYTRERNVMAIASKCPRILGKIFFGMNYPQAILWTREKRLAMKMSIMYMMAKEYFIESGIPKELLEIAAKMFDNLQGKPITEKHRKAVRFVSVAWHSRTVRVFHLLVEEFRSGKNITSYGCGSGIVELLALFASGNKDVKLTLIDVEPSNIALAQELATLFCQHGYAIDKQVTIILGDASRYRLPPDTDTSISIGLLHNYYPLDTANALMLKWFADGATKVITDICYDPQDVAHKDADIRLSFINKILNWKFGPPDGLLLYSYEKFCDSLSSSDRHLKVYDHGLNATIVVS